MSDKVVVRADAVTVQGLPPSQRGTPPQMGRRRISTHRAVILGAMVGLVVGLATVCTFLVVRILTDNTRKVLTTVLCQAIRDNAKLEDRQTGFYQYIIVAGAKGSRPFEPLLRRYGAPPYSVRVKQAEAQAAQAGALQAVLPDCKRLVRLVTHRS